MATILSSFYTGSARPLLPNPFRAGSPITFQVVHTFLTPVTTADVLDLFPLPQGARVASFEAVGASIGAINLDIGKLTGTPGDTSGARTLGPLLIDDGSASASALTSSLALRLAFGAIGDTPESLGLVPAANITAGSNKTLTILMTIY